MGRPIQGWDPVILISQIISLQTIHYLLLSLLIPPLLSTLTDTTTLTYSGGPYSASYVMDWREMASRSTALKVGPVRTDVDGKEGTGEGMVLEPRDLLNRSPGDSNYEATEYYTKSPIRKATIPLSLLRGHPHLESEPESSSKSDEWDPDTFDYGVDRRRGWVLGLVWVVVSCLDIFPIYLLVRKPTHVLDHSLTLAFIHICLTTYHTGGRFPFSLFFWTVLGVGGLVMIVGAEQLCVRREMNQTLKAASWESTPLDRGLADDLEELEMEERG